jgi:hypothetical protein
VNPPGAPTELIRLTETPAFLESVRVAATRAFERFEPAIDQPDYSARLAVQFAKVFIDGLRSDTSEGRADFLNSFVRDGLGAGASALMLVRRFTFLVTCVIADLAGSVPPAALPECDLWLAGFASGSVCDLLMALQHQSPKHKLEW